MSSRRTPAEIALFEEIGLLRTVRRIALGADEHGMPIPGARVDVGAAVRAAQIIAGLRIDMSRRQSVRLANAKRDPITRTAALRKIAESDGSWVAAARLNAIEVKLREEAAAIALQAADAADRVLTAEEWESEVRDDASSATDQDLEHYVAEFFRRQGYLMVATGDELELRRLAP